MFEHENHNYLYLDIETLPEGEVDFEQLKTKEELEELVPKSYTGKKAEEWIEKTFNEQTSKLNDEHRAKALDSLKGRIFCIGLAFNDEPEDIIEYNVDERVILENLQAWIKKHVGEQKIYNTIFVGKNVKKFDIRWIFHRAVKYKIYDLMRWLPLEKYDKRIEDIGDMFDLYSYGVYSKLDDMAKFLGLAGKEDVDGSMVYDLFLNNEYEKIYEYCRDGDVRQTRIIHKMLKGIEIK